MTAKDIVRADDLVRIGADHLQQGRYREAAHDLLRAIELKHDCGQAHYHLGRLHLAQGQNEDAADCFQLAVHFSPDLSEAWQALGHFEKSLGNLEQAVHCYRKAIMANPASPDAQCQLAFLLYKLGCYEESHAVHAAALALKPDFIEAHHNLGLLFLETGFPQEALACFERALALKPALHETRTCIAHALRDLERLDEAIAAYDAVLAEHPAFGDAIINRSYALLMRGDYAEGWAQHERRYAATGTPLRNFPFSQWRGEPLAGKRVLVYAEQGLGDEIMFASCLPDLIAQAEEVVVECNTRLVALFTRSFPQARVHGGNKADGQKWLTRMPQIDYQIAAGSLPLHFRRSAAAFPVRRNYLTADPERVEYWHQQLTAASGKRFNVGMAWRGGALRSRQFTRSIALDHWMPLLRQKQVNFVSLQYGEVSQELAQFQATHGVTIRDLREVTTDLDELAALIRALDVVITVDNTVAHMAGALGQSVWTLLPAAPEWRYPRQGESMPWYASMRLFRQPRSATWAPVIAEVTQALAVTTVGS